MKMSKTVYLPIIAVLLLVGLGTAGADVPPQDLPPPPAPVNRAIRIVIRGGILGFDRNAYQSFRAVLGSLVANETIDTFIKEDNVLDGGGIFCAQLPTQSGDSVEILMALLKVIQVNTASTTYTVTPVLKCDQGPALF